MDRQGTCEIPLASTGATSRNAEHRLIKCSRPGGDLRVRRERFGGHEQGRSAWELVTENIRERDCAGGKS